MCSYYKYIHLQNKVTHLTQNLSSNGLVGSYNKYPRVFILYHMSINGKNFDQEQR